MWELYDALISKIPDDIEVTEFLSGSSMTYVCAGDAAGVCETIGGGLYSGWGTKTGQVPIGARPVLSVFFPRWVRLWVRKFRKIKKSTRFLNKTGCFWSWIGDSNPGPHDYESPAASPGKPLPVPPGSVKNLAVSMLCGPGWRKSRKTQTPRKRRKKVKVLEMC